MKENHSRCGLFCLKLIINVNLNEDSVYHLVDLCLFHPCILLATCEKVKNTTAKPQNKWGNDRMISLAACEASDQPKREQTNGCSPDAWSRRRVKTFHEKIGSLVAEVWRCARRQCVKRNGLPQRASRPWPERRPPPSGRRCRRSSPTSCRSPPPGTWSPVASAQGDTAL